MRWWKLRRDAMRARFGLVVGDNRLKRSRTRRPDCITGGVDLVLSGCATFGE